MIKPKLSSDLYVIILLVILVVALRLPSLDEPFEMDSGANAYHARLILQGEPLYSTHHPAHHLPGVYYTYALAFLLFGDSTWSVKFLLIPWTILTAYIIYLIGIRLEGKNTAVLAAVFYSILNSHVLLKGSTAETELFANLIIATAILLGIDLLLKQSADWKFIFVGMLCATAFLYKVVFLSTMVVVGCMILLNAWITSRDRQAWKTAFIRSLWVGAGFLTIAFCIMGWFARLGLLSRLLLVFTLGQGYVDQLSAKTNLISVLILPIYILVFNNIVLLLLSFHGAIRIIQVIIKKHLTDRKFTIIGSGIVIWYILSIMVAGITRRGWPHYSIIIVPPLSILSAWEIVQLHRKFTAKKIAGARFLSISPIAILLIVALLVSGLSNYQLYNHYIRFKLGIESYEVFLRKGSYLEGSNAIKMLKIAKYIQSHTTKDDFIYTWSDNAQVYYLADRRAPIDIIWPSYVEATGPYQRIFIPRTKYIIVGNSVVAANPKWLDKELEKSYTLEIIIEDMRIYHRIGQ